MLCVVDAHALSALGAHTGQSGGPGSPVLVAVVDGPDQAARALAEGADLIDASACTPEALAAILTRLPATALWTGVPANPVDADPRSPEPASPGGGAPLATVAARAAIGTWLGAAAIRTRHARAARRAIDMTASVRGTRPPALTVRGLA